MQPPLNEKTFRKNRTLEIAGAAVFGAASAVVALITAPILPRLAGWGIAFIDPVSILWISCYIMFGARSGIICSVIGTIALMPADPFAPVGPLMKFAATVPMIIIPTLLLRLWFRKPSSANLRVSLQLTAIRKYIIMMGAATLVRDIVMVFFNIALFLTIMAPILPYVSLAGITGWDAIIIVAVLINSEQSIWDTLIPWLALRPTGVQMNYATW